MSNTDLHTDMRPFSHKKAVGFDQLTVDTVVNQLVRKGDDKDCVVVARSERGFSEYVFSPEEFYGAFRAQAIKKRLEDFFANPHDLLPAAWTASAMSDWQKKYETVPGHGAWYHDETRGLLALEQVNEIACSGRWRGWGWFASSGFSLLVSQVDRDHSSCIQLLSELPDAALPEAAKMLMELRDHYSSLAEPLAPPALPAPSVNHTLSSLPDARYKLIEPIPVHIEQQSDDSWTASFEEANISMSGTSLEDAKQALADDIGYALDLLLSERDTLSPVLQHQLAVLERYVRRDSQ